MGVGESSTKSKEDRLLKEAISLLQSLASEWNDVTDSKALQVIPLKGAMTNEVYQIKWPTNTEYVSRKVLVRVFGEGVDIFFDRSDEIKMFEFISRQGQGPRSLGRFPSGRLEEFIHARACVNEIDFNYKEYANQRFERYRTQRDTLLGLCGSPSASGTEDSNHQLPPPNKRSILKTMKKVFSLEKKKG